MKNKKPILIVIAGPNGSGKTSITSTILKHQWIENCIYINPDNIANDMFGDWNSRESILQAAEYAENLREKCIEQNTSLIFETVLSAENKIDFQFCCDGMFLCEIICVIFFFCAAELLQKQTIG